MAAARNAASIFAERSAGILLHPTSLPGPLANGDIGHDAYRFIELLHQCGVKVWQMLPLGATHEDKSPYQCLSAHAGNPALISLDWLVDRGWLDRKRIKVAETDDNYRSQCLLQAESQFYTHAGEEWASRLAAFREEHVAWLEDYALFMVLKQKYQWQPWFTWPAVVRHRDVEAMREVSLELADEMAQVIFEQFVFFTQWHEVRAYAARHNVKLFGDMPIFVALDSADVWAKRSNFLMDDDGEMSYVSGVPPDAFSDTGQRWGNPLYDWAFMQANDFDWWKSRFATQVELFDLVRIDHFRGLDACWMIPAREETAIHGHWEDVPGEALLSALFAHFPNLPLVAEDLGVITDKVIALKEAFGLPGMKVLQFAFDGNNKNPHLPHRHRREDLVYTGTHDNDTTLGWAKDKNSYNQKFFKDYSGCESDLAEDKLLAMLRMAMSSVSFLCVLPMQDMLMLGSEARMNVPGTVGGNWQWRFDWQQLKPAMIERMKGLISLYQR
ncbi:4-alpha-glucanotransferase [Sulfuriflexus mobilis]|uniref:4-alpha-glucanotransferase n=1 Tax=Sulfuriflexus mobilis TaxID=1811807 RepID=UPI000F82F41E|nr:4-alpha-glucanotransferase [Sulfuriflexus mobilis]